MKRSVLLSLVLLVSMSNIPTALADEHTLVPALAQEHIQDEKVIPQRRLSLLKKRKNKKESRNPKSQEPVTGIAPAEVQKPKIPTYFVPDPAYPSQKRTGSVTPQPVREVKAPKEVSVPSVIATSAVDSSKNVKTIYVEAPKKGFDDDDDRYGLSEEQWSKISDSDKNVAQMGCWGFGDEERSQCKAPRFLMILDIKKTCDTTQKHCVLDAMLVHDYCEKHPSSSCTEVQTKLVKKAREHCDAEYSKLSKKEQERFDDYGCFKNKLEGLRYDSFLEGINKPATSGPCATCQAIPSH